MRRWLARRADQLLPGLAPLQMPGVDNASARPPPRLAQCSGRPVLAFGCNRAKTMPAALTRGQLRLNQPASDAQHRASNGRGWLQVRSSAARPAPVSATDAVPADLRASASIFRGGATRQRILGVRRPSATNRLNAPAERQQRARSLDDSARAKGSTSSVHTPVPRMRSVSIGSIARLRRLKRRGAGEPERWVGTSR